MKRKKLFTLILIGGGIYYFFFYNKKKTTTAINPNSNKGLNQYTDYEIISPAQLNGLPRRTRDAIA